MAFPVIGPDGHPTLWAEIDTQRAADFGEIEQLYRDRKPAEKGNAWTVGVGRRRSRMDRKPVQTSSDVLNHKPLPKALKRDLG